MATVRGMADNPGMGVYQVLEDPSGPGAFEVVPSSLDSDPTAFEASGRRPAYFGSTDIVNLAVSLERANYKPAEVAIVDRRFEALRPESVEGEAGALISAIDEGDQDKSMRVLLDQFEDLIVESLTMRGRGAHRGSIIRLLQDGRIQVVRAADGDEPINDVRHALNEAH